MRKAMPRPRSPRPRSGCHSGTEPVWGSSVAVMGVDADAVGVAAGAADVRATGAAGRAAPAIVGPAAVGVVRVVVVVVDVAPAEVVVVAAAAVVVVAPAPAVVVVTPAAVVVVAPAVVVVVAAAAVVVVAPAAVVVVVAPVVVVVGAGVHDGSVITLESSVTEALRASNRPLTVESVLAVIALRAITVPTRREPTPRVAELPICQNTLHACAPLRNETVLLVAVMSVEPAWKMKTESGSF